MKVKDFSYLEIKGLPTNFMEIRLDYNGSNQPIYVGYNRNPNADITSPTWFIVKLNYVGGNLSQQQLPNSGVQFIYEWALRTTYFS